jgi:hypothetical protein
MLTGLMPFLTSRTAEESYEVLRNHPDLLNPAVDELIEMGLSGLRRRNDAHSIAAIRERHELLVRCRQVGVDRAFSERFPNFRP